jgi:hypothetical protein
MSSVADLSLVVSTLRATVAAILTEQVTVAPVTVINGHPINLPPGSLPSICIDLVTVTRREPGEPESEMGSYDWHITVPISIYVAANENYLDPAAGMSLAELLMCNAVIAIDADPQLDPQPASAIYRVVEAVIPSAESFVGALNQTAEPVIGYQLELHAYLLLSQPT